MENRAMFALMIPGDSGSTKKLVHNRISRISRWRMGHWSSSPFCQLSSRNGNARCHVQQSHGTVHVTA
eukprot:1171114-Rhodomonas_salina.2